MKKNDTSGGVYRAGWRTIDVTPPSGCFLAGYASRLEPATAIYRRLFATVVAIDDGGDPIILVSIEWLGFYERAEEARIRISRSTGVRPDRIILTATHTHAGPLIREIDRQRHGYLDAAYVENTLAQIAGAAKEALVDRRACTLRFGTDWCGFAVSRRAPDGKGGVVWAPSLDAPHDHTVAALFIEQEETENRLVAFNYACHPTSTGPILQIGGDYPGFTCDRIRESLGPSTTGVFFNGCSGDQRPGPPDGNDREFLPYSLEQVRALGIRLAEAVVRAAARTDRVNGSIRVAQTLLTLESAPIDRVAIGELAHSARAWERGWAKHYAGVLESGAGYETGVPFEVQTLQFGNHLAFVALAGEMCVEYGIRLKRVLHKRFTHAMISGYANEIAGYVPVDRQIPEAGYEVTDNHRILLRPGSFAKGTEEKIINAVCSLTKTGKRPNIR